MKNQAPHYQPTLISTGTKIGVTSVQGGRATIIGVTHHLDDADIQKLVNSKTNRTVEFSYHAIDIDRQKVGIIRIPRQARPTYLLKSYGKLQAQTVYLRHGSSTSVATPDEIARMGTDQRTPPNPELTALNIALQQAQFAERIWQLIQDTSQLPDHTVTNIARPEYDKAKWALITPFHEDYRRFRTAMSTARDLLTAQHAVARDAQQQAIAPILKAMSDVQTTVEQFIAASNETYATQHTNARDNARQAAEHLSALVTRRIVSIEPT